MLGERVVRITVKPFMDMSTMIEERLTQCCVHVGTRSPTRISARRSARCRRGRSCGAQRMSVAAGAEGRLPLEVVP